MLYSTLLFRPGGLGDLLIVAPSIRLLRIGLPDHKLTLVCREEYGRLLEATKVVDATISSDDRSMAGLFYEGEDSTPQSTWIRGYSGIVGWMIGTRGATLEGRCRALGVNRCSFVGPPEAESGTFSRHYFERTKEVLRRLSPGCRESPGFDFCALLPIGDDMRRESLRFFGIGDSGSAQGFAVIHPGGGSPKKRWPLGNFLEVARQWSARGLGGVIITGEAEEDLAEELAHQPLPAGWRWYASPPICGLAGLLAACKLYLGNDSGVTHLAAASGCRVLALFRRRFVSLWTPFGNTRVLSESEVSAIELSRVLEESCRMIGRQ